MAGDRYITNEELGRRIGVGHSMASRIRSGHRAPGLQTMRRLSSELGIPIEALVAAHGEGPKATGALVRARLRELSAGSSGASEDRDTVAA